MWCINTHMNCLYLWNYNNEGFCKNKVFWTFIKKLYPKLLILTHIWTQHDLNFAPFAIFTLQMIINELLIVSMACHPYITLHFPMSLREFSSSNRIVAVCCKAANHRTNRSSHIRCFRWAGARWRLKESAQTDVCVRLCACVWPTRLHSQKV